MNDYISKKELLDNLPMSPDASEYETEGEYWAAKDLYDEIISDIEKAYEAAAEDGKWSEAY